MTTGLELRSKITSSGKLELSLEEVAIPEPAAGQVLIRVEGSPINPSDLGLLTGPADLSTLVAGGTADRPTLTANVAPERLPMVAARFDQSMAVGNEGAGTVIAAGAGAESLLGKKVATLGGSMYATHKLSPAGACLPLPDDATAADGASCFVNPLTALSFPETMRAEGHKAMVHTAAASNLGQMLVKICQADGIPLVNIVRSAEQVKLLKELGAKYVLDSTTATFKADLVDALAETGATIGFDAIGGGPLAGDILACMEVALNRTAGAYSRYGSSTHKQVYIYGALDLRPTEIGRNVGLSWGTGGYLLTYFMQKAGPEVMNRLRARVAAELKTTFASHYTAEISLAEALNPDTLKAYSRRATGEKYLINPAK
ncbi:zinc-binding dehydrogenase [Caulobacter sp. SLTY]|uniref:zinc-binding dehydrogenase n=1 Tax=Caulobacter sp. SLTY TaxID=2683262 RepID=UPI0014127F88|nr:zinc-binding dehydrogenase [Caulobacter sp. SLTY]NBB15783.1 zinc-binding dehydrogenase [Caulobacter sp. SLTY]